MGNCQTQQHATSSPGGVRNKQRPRPKQVVKNPAKARPPPRECALPAGRNRQNTKHSPGNVARNTNPVKGTAPVNAPPPPNSSPCRKPVQLGQKPVQGRPPLPTTTGGNPLGRTPHNGQKPNIRINKNNAPLKKAHSNNCQTMPRTQLRSTPQAKQLYNQKTKAEMIDPSKWKLSEMKFAGSATYEELGKQEDVKGQSIREGIQSFRANPSKYVAFMYQTSMIDWPVKDQKYSLIHRAGTRNYKPANPSPSGWMTVLLQEYQHLKPMNDLPEQYKDKYTDSTLAVHAGRKCGKPILPGRGMGVGDSPNLKIIGDVDPSDIAQGTVGDCWLLSGISSLAEFDGAVKKIFRKTPNLHQMPLDGPNRYVVTLWDLATWKEVDIVIDERLCTIDGRSLLASKPSEDGELWVCYLEKALAAHCGGWDKITGGQCTHAWALLTGCKEQYTISKTKTGKYACYAKFNPTTRQWSRHANSPHDGETTIWNAAWPAVGGGGIGEIDQETLFQKMCSWDKNNFIVGAATSGTSDKNTTGGVVDNHAYSVIECINDVAGTDIDLIKVRNPWGKGEIENGEFDDDGPGWNRYPQIKKALNPVSADDGIFWVTKQEFFRFFQSIYLSASNMTEFLED